MKSEFIKRLSELNNARIGKSLPRSLMDEYVTMLSNIDPFGWRFKRPPKLIARTELTKPMIVLNDESITINYP